MLNGTKAVRGAVATAVVVAAFGAAGTALAGGDKVDSKVTIKKNDGFAFKGNVSSDKGVCVKSRDVTVYLKKEGPDQNVGADKTDSGGKFRVEVNVFLANNPYYAVAEKKQKDGTTCKESKSKVFVTEPN